MSHLELRNLFFNYWTELPRNHVKIPSSSLVPENDPSVLFTTAGMHPLVPYLLGQPHPLGKRLVSCQKCLRTDDIDEVGDAIHHTFFEMLGNWSLGDYFKEEAISWSYEFLIDRLKLDPNRLYVTCFIGDKDAPKDTESATVWKRLGIPEKRIKFYGKKENWWGPAGETGPCGPDSEMHYDVTEKPHNSDCQPNENCGRFSEIWNDVFMQYNKNKDGKFEKLAQKNVDTGMGLERTLAVINGLDDDYRTELWWPAIQKLEELSGHPYEENLHTLRSYRIIADHLRATIFAISDGVRPSNKERGYILRRLIRRSIVKLIKIGIDDTNKSSKEIIDIFIETMSSVYPELNENRQVIHDVVIEEISKFNKTLAGGIKEFNRMLPNINAFDLFQSYGFPIELTAEMAAEQGIKIDMDKYLNDYKKHQELSRTSSSGMFKGGLVDQSEQVTKYHTATHLLQAALRKILGDQVHQEGSNLTSERLRFDFSYSSKLTPEQVSLIENLVNEQIQNNLEQKKETLPYDEAIKSGALAFFKERYPEKVTVYSFGTFSKEICGGPHVERTGILGKFKIIKQESVAAGIRRIYAVLE